MNKSKFVIFLIILFNSVILFRVIFLMCNDELKNSYNDLNNNLLELGYAPRGRILDSNGKILVDNKGKRALIYNKLSGASLDDELFISLELSKYLELDTSSLDDLDILEYYYLSNRDLIDNRVSKEMLDNYNNRKIDINEFTNYKYSLITDDEFNSVNKESVLIYKLMNKGYYYEDKIITDDVDDSLFLVINDLNLIGIRIDMIYERVYNYDTYFNDLFGDIGYIQEDKKNYYLDLGYKLNDIVGISFLEEEYEEYLKGKKAKYELRDNELVKVSDVVRGNDLVLGIDIDLQIKIENILKEQIVNAKEYKSSKYYNGSYIVLSDSDTGLIKSLVGLKYEDGKFKSNIIGAVTNSFTVGSVVKGASQYVSYSEGVLDSKVKINDSCIKLKNQGEKCSHKNLGLLNDINALAYSSNYFQFINAIKVTGNKYTRNMVFNPDKAYFDSYREYFKLFGLGDYTGIDIGKETSGIIGNKVSGDLLLNYVIGQYDTYSVLQLNQYISTISNGGIRYKLRIGDYIIDNNSNAIFINNKYILNRVDSSYLERIKLGFNAALKYGTAVNYFDPSLGGGKTGTSETFYNNKSTITKSFVGYFNVDNTNYALSIISPNISYENSETLYVYPINSRLTRQITNILFEN